MQTLELEILLRFQCFLSVRLQHSVHHTHENGNVLLQLVVRAQECLVLFGGDDGGGRRTSDAGGRGGGEEGSGGSGGGGSLR